MFSVKEPIPRGLRAGVVYKFLCAGLSTCHVGKMTRHFSTRVREQKEPLLSGSRYFRSGKKKFVTRNGLRQGGHVLRYLI